MARRQALPGDKRLKDPTTDHSPEHTRKRLPSSKNTFYLTLWNVSTSAIHKPTVLRHSERVRLAKTP